MRTSLALIADDLTGALDAAAQLRTSGYSTRIALCEPLRGDHCWPIGGATVIGLSTESRHDEPARAAEKITWAMSHARRWPTFKKIDSTLRGNVGAEVEALLRLGTAKHVIMAPAFPSQGRTTEDGRLLVNGRPLSETEFANDPISPMRTSSIAEILAEQTEIPTIVLPLAVVDQGPGAVASAISAMPKAIVICDAVTQTDLQTIVSGAVRADAGRLLCGSAGLAAALPDALALGEPDATAPPALPAGPLLIVVGSRHPTTRQQLKQSSVYGVSAQAEVLCRGVANRAVDEITENLREGRNVTLAVASGEVIPGAAKAIVAGLAATARAVMDAMTPAGLVMTGGDTATAVCSRLDAEVLELNGVVLPGIPMSTLHGGRYDGLGIVTKAGGFGAPDTLERIIRWWKHNRHGQFSQ